MPTSTLAPVRTLREYPKQTLSSDSRLDVYDVVDRFDLVDIDPNVQTIYDEDGVETERRPNLLVHAFRDPDYTWLVLNFPNRVPKSVLEHPNVHVKAFTKVDERPRVALGFRTDERATIVVPDPEPEPEVREDADGVPGAVITDDLIAQTWKDLSADVSSFQAGGSGEPRTPDTEPEPVPAAPTPEPVAAPVEKTVSKAAAKSAANKSQDA